MERRRLRDRERRQSMSQDERERHLARRRKKYKLRRQRAEVSRIGSQIQEITGEGSQLAAVTSPPQSGDSSTVPSLFDSDQSVGISVEEFGKLVGTIRLSRVKHMARTLRKWRTSGAEASSSNIGAKRNDKTCNVKWATSESSETTGEIKGPAGGVVVTTFTSNTRNPASVEFTNLNASLITIYVSVFVKVNTFIFLETYLC